MNDMEAEIAAADAEVVAAEVTDILRAAISDWQNKSPRSVLARHGYLGASDIGFCRQKAKYVTIGTEPTDNPPKWAAFLGTAIGKEIELAIHNLNLGWYIGSVGNIEVVATFPSGATMGGHPDIIAPDLNAILDIKTVDGFEWVKREGSSLSHKYQRHIYALGALQQGILDSSRPVYVGNLYFDRSGGQQHPLVVIEEMDPTLTAEIDSWIQDVIYAVHSFEDASRDIPAARCESICEFFTVCRGGLEVHNGGEQISDPETIAAVSMYVDARDLAKQAEQMKAEAQSRLVGVNGSTDDYQVRWVEVQPTVVESFEKRGYMRMDVRKIRK